MKNDRRVRYTRMMLKKSLLEILQEKPIDRISVKELCERADVNRSTFYVHYGSPQELLDNIRQEMLEEIRGRRFEDYSDLMGQMTQVCDVIYEYRELLKILTDSGSHTELFFQIADIWKEDFKQGMRKLIPTEETAELAHLYVTTGAMSVIITWAFGGFRMGRDEVVGQVYRLVMNGLNSWTSGKV